MYCLLFPYHCVLNKINWCLTNGILVICTRRQDAMPFHKTKFSGGMYRGLTLSNNCLNICVLVSYKVGTYFEGDLKKVG